MRKWLIAFCIMACIASGYLTVSTIYDHSSSKGTSFKNMCSNAKHPTFKRKGSWNSSGTFVPLAS